MSIETFGIDIDDELLGEVILFEHFDRQLMAADIDIDMGVRTHDHMGTVLLARRQHDLCIRP